MTSSPDRDRNFIVQALKGEPITVYGKGRQTRSFCYVSDLIEGLMRLMASDDEFTGPRSELHRAGAEGRADHGLRQRPPDPLVLLCLRPDRRPDAPDGER